MKLQRPFILVFFLMLASNLFAQEKNLQKASELGEALTESNEEDAHYFGNWEVIDAESDSSYINLMPKEDGTQGQYLILKPTVERSLISSYGEDGYYSVDLGFYVYRKGTKFYANLDASVAVVFEMEYKGQLIEFECEYLDEKDQLKLTTIDGIVFYLQRVE